MALYYYSFFYFVLDYFLTYFGVRFYERTEINPLNSYLLKLFGPNIFFVLLIAVILIFFGAIKLIKRINDNLPFRFLRAFVIATAGNAANLVIAGVSMFSGWQWFEIQASRIPFYTAIAVIFAFVYLFYGQRKNEPLWFWSCLSLHLLVDGLIFLIL